MPVLSDLFSTKPLPGSNAAAIGGIGMLSLLGIFSTNPYIALGSFGASLALLTTGFLISQTDFGKNDLVESLKSVSEKFYNSYIRNFKSGAENGR